jgi:hypothetical protein
LSRSAAAATAAALLLALHASLSIWSARGECAAHDEGIHLAAGVATWRTGEHRLSPEHPPLLRLVAALPVVLAGARFELADDRYRNREQGQVGAAFLHEWNDERAVLLWARLALLALMLLGGIAVAAVARWLYGTTAALLALALFALSPDFLAHGHYVATDAGVAVLLFAATAAWWRVRERPTAWRFAAASVLSGLAISAKFSALLLPLWVLPLFLPDLVRVERHERAPVLGRLAVGAALAAAIALLVVAAVYGLSLDDFVSGVRLRAASLERPWTYLLGEGSETGFLSYFAVAFSTKTPLPLLGLLAVSAALVLLRPRDARAHREIALLLPVLVIGAATTLSRFNAGHRHLLPVYPFLFVLAAKVVEGHASSRARWRGPLAAAAVALSAVSVARAAPHFHSYLNEAAGGPRAASLLFADSTVDWGQDLPALRQWMLENDVPRVRLGYLGAGSPSYEGIPSDPLPGRGFAMTPRRDLPETRRIEPLRKGEWIAVNLACRHAARNEAERRFWSFLDDRRASDRAAFSFFLYLVDSEMEERGNAALERLRQERARRR